MLLLTIKKVFDKSELVSYDAGETSLIVSDCTPGLQLSIASITVNDLSSFPTLFVIQQNHGNNIYLVIKTFSLIHK